LKAILAIIKSGLLLVEMGTSGRIKFPDLLRSREVFPRFDRGIA
jgi:hypothetical protein